MLNRAGTGPLTGVTGISVGTQFACARMSSGQARCWGYNTVGQLGSGISGASQHLPVVVKDRPGQLGRLFADAGKAEVNIEDVSIEHSPGQPVGVVELSVRPERAATLADALRARGWSVHG